MAFFCVSCAECSYCAISVTLRTLQQIHNLNLVFFQKIEICEILLLNFTSNVFGRDGVFIPIIG